MNDTVEVSRKWLSQFDFEKYGCPFCGGHNFTVKKGDEKFHDRRGCLDCDKWIDDVKLKY